VVETDKKYNYKCQRECPAPDSMVTKGITYPFCVVKINSKKKLLLNKNATISSGILYKQFNTRIGI
jgi:hypothetical protein